MADPTSKTQTAKRGPKAPGVGRALLMVPKAAVVVAPTATIVAGAQAVESGPMVKKKDFIDRAVVRSGVKKKDARPAVEAALAVMADALKAGEELNLPPLGKVKVNRVKKLKDATMLIVKIRIPNEAGKSASADMDDDGDAAPLAATDD